ncbi:hypothetical protein [Spongiimicrobium salis]|uniref:hypothetical protein n=1 Tax=Spongiimicrobium salis TaxID=1667022 RepID=UPI00374CA911
MTVEELINLGACGAGAALGSNLSGGCLQQIQAASSIWALSPSFTFDPARELNLAYVQEIQATGNLIVLRGINSFEENGNADAIETLEDDTQEVTNEGKYMFMATYKKGLYNNRVLHSLKGFGGWKIAIVDKAGAIFMTQNANGIAQGFNTGMIQPEKMTFASNTVAAKEALKFQFLDRFEVDENYVFIERANLDFDPRLVDGITEVRLTIPVNPANADTSIRVKAVRDQDGKSPILDLEFGDFLLKKNNVTDNPTAKAAVAGDTTLSDLTVAALSTNDVLELSLYDSANNRSVINKNGNLYKSVTVSKTVA